jgi:molybdopterin-guanine dinucleotide biosynthesis protein A
VKPTALILAGGRARRLGGVDKRMLVVDGSTIFERQVAVLAPRTAEIIVSAHDPIPGFRTVHDLNDGLGPIAGIAAGLAATTTPWLLVVPSDLPYLSGALIDAMLARTSGGAGAVACAINGRPEPLPCVLRCDPVLAVVVERIAALDYKLARLLMDSRIATAWIDESELVAVEPQWRRALLNVNTPADLDEARSLLRRSARPN